jgi:hypothetical protein
MCEMEEKPHCNICDINIDTTSMTEEHSSTSVHLFRKSNFEKILKIISTGKLRGYGDSVISCWKKSNGS